MGVDINIKLPLHLKASHLLKVMAKLSGHEMIKRPLGDDEETVDLNLPCEKDNAWSIRFDKDNIRIDHKPEIDADFSMIEYVNTIEENRTLYFHRIPEDEDCQLLTSRSNPWNVALGNRLIEFFGGSIIYNDSYDKADKKVINKNAIFPRRLPTQVGDDRFFQFYNALDQLKPITAEEVLGAQKKAAYSFDQKQLSQWEHLRVQEMASKEKDELEQSTIEIPTQRRSPRRGL